MTSTKGRKRERELARAKYERQLARRAAKTRRRRQIQAGVGVLALIAAGFGVAWLLGAFDSDDPAQTPEQTNTEADLPTGEDQSAEPSAGAESGDGGDSTDDPSAEAENSDGATDEGSADAESGDDQ